MAIERIIRDHPEKWGMFHRRWPDGSEELSKK